MARLDQLFSTSGDGTGATNMAALPANYMVRPAANEVIEIARILVHMTDAGKFAGEKYSAAGALANGIVITKRDTTGIVHNYTPQPIKVLGHWGLLAGVDMIVTDFTTGNDIVLVRWTLSKADHKTTLDGRKGEYLNIEVKDTMVAFVEHQIQAQGNVFWVNGD